MAHNRSIDSPEHGGPVPDGSDPGPIGGQAIVEGVMMRRGQCWGAAVRRPDDTIVTTFHELPPVVDRWRRIPLVRGIVSLGESVGLGAKATTWGARTRVPEDEGGMTRTGVGISLVVAVALAVGVFGLAPALVARAVGPRSSLAFNLVEGALRLALLFGYLLLLSRSPSIRRVFAYHGAEHMTIHAFEHGVDLEPASIRRFDRRHPRCGTSFLLVVVMVAVVTNLFLGRPGWPVLVASRLLLLPVIASLAYELIRFAGRHQTTWVGRVLMAPGYLLQAITTRPPDDDQILVAVAALRATITRGAADPQPAAPLSIPEPDGGRAEAMAGAR